MSTETNQVDKSTENYDEDIKKYTKIDNLDEDSVVDSSKYFLVSFISPEGVMNCKTRGFKIRTYKNKVCFSTLEEAKVAADEINKKDKYFHVFVGETGKWMGWDPAPDDRTQVESEKWANTEQDAIMQNLRDKEDKQLNDLNALVGKKKDIINKEGKQHKKRVANAIKESAKPRDDSKTQEFSEVIDEETMQKESIKTKSTEQNITKKPHDPLVIREKLRKKLQEKKMNDKQQIDTSALLKDKLVETVETQNKLDENIKKLNDILNKAKIATK